MNSLSPTGLDLLFREARTFSKWLDRPLSPEILRAVHDLAILGPTSVNSQPGRFVFIVSAEAKERLRPALAPGNLAKTMAAPATVIVGHDLDFPDTLPKTFPHADVRGMFLADEALRQTTAFRNGTLQGAYLILAARALGLDAGPMSGFDNAKVDAAFFPEGRVKSNFLVNLGYGDRGSLHPRGPRLAFEETARIL